MVLVDRAWLLGKYRSRQAEYSMILLVPPSSPDARIIIYALVPGGRSRALSAVCPAHRIGGTLCGQLNRCRESPRNDARHDLCSHRGDCAIDPPSNFDGTAPLG